VTIWKLIGVMLLLLVLGAVLLENAVAAHRCGSYTAGCRANLKCLSTALEMYANDHRRCYPDRLQQLTPTYLKTIPTCPWSAADDYSRGYEVYNAMHPDLSAYTICCTAKRHYRYIDLLPLSPMYPTLPVRLNAPAPSISLKEGLK
jgi:hypothetical protein